MIGSQWINVSLILFVLGVTYSVYQYAHITPPEEREKPLDWFEPTGRSLSLDSEYVNLRFFLHDHAGDELEAELMRVSDPKSPDFSRHLSVTELAALLKCRPSIVVDHIHRATSTDASTLQVHVSSAGDLVELRATIRQASAIFGNNVRFGEFVLSKHIQSGEKRFWQGAALTRLGVDPRDEAMLLSGAALPADVSKEVESAFGFGVLLSGSSTKFQNVPHPYVSFGGYPPNKPTDLYRNYNYTPPTKWKTPAGAQAIYIQGQGFRSKDLNTFFQKYVPELKGELPKLMYGKLDPTGWDIEAVMDIEYIMTFGRYLPTQMYAFDDVYNDQKGYEALAKFASMLVEAKGPLKPWVSSASWGPSKEIPNLQRATDRAFMKAGLLGVSIMSASGDDHCDPSPDCAHYEMDKPAGPHVTLVGGVTCDTATGSKTAWVGTSGGFTSIYDIPSWQKAAVDHYFKIEKDLPPSTMYNRSKRGVPDISLCANNVVSFDITGEDDGGGTSYASPAFAGLVSSLNQYRAEHGKKPLGFLNPLLYHLSTTCKDCFLDITKGNNQMGSDKYHECPHTCNGDRACKGFNAAHGWDPVTGVGMPNFGNILREVLKLP